MNNKGQSAMASVALAALVFVIVLAVYGQVQTVHDSIVNENTVHKIDTVSENTNAPIFNSSVQTLVNLLPLVLVGALLVGITIVALRLGS